MESIMKFSVAMGSTYFTISAPATSRPGEQDVRSSGPRYSNRGLPPSLRTLSHRLLRLRTQQPQGVPARDPRLAPCLFRVRQDSLAGTAIQRCRRVFEERVPAFAQPLDAKSLARRLAKVDPLPVAGRTHPGWLGGCLAEKSQS